MTVEFLTKMLVSGVRVEIKDIETGETIWNGLAGYAKFSDTVKDWDFSKGHIIYI